MAKAKVMQGLPTFYLSDTKESKEEKAAVVLGLPILYLSDAKESKKEDGEGRGDAGVANVEKEVGEGLGQARPFVVGIPQQEHSPGTS
jgi:hypothetical protein